MARRTFAAIAALSTAEGALAGMLARLMAVVEAYPELKADATMRELSEELSHTENRIAFARQAFNDAVLDYNNAAQQAPATSSPACSGSGPRRCSKPPAPTPSAKRSASAPRV